jgi:hypothetical protein
MGLDEDRVENLRRRARSGAETQPAVTGFASRKERPATRERCALQKITRSRASSRDAEVGGGRRTSDVVGMGEGVILEAPGLVGYHCGHQ